MEKLSDELVETRMGEPLETMLQKDHKYMQRQKELAGVLRECWEIRPRTKKQRVRKSDKIWDSIGRYNYSYGEAAYEGRAACFHGAAWFSGCAICADSIGR